MNILKLTTLVLLTFATTAQAESIYDWQVKTQHRVHLLETRSTKIENAAKDLKRDLGKLSQKNEALESYIQNTNRLVTNNSNDIEDIKKMRAADEEITRRFRNRLELLNANVLLLQNKVKALEEK